MGDGTNLAFEFEGEGTVRVTLSQDPANFIITGADSISYHGGNIVEMNYATYGNQSGDIRLQ